MRTKVLRAKTSKVVTARRRLEQVPEPATSNSSSPELLVIVRGCVRVVGRCESTPPKGLEE